MKNINPYVIFDFKSLIYNLLDNKTNQLFLYNYDENITIIHDNKYNI